MAYLAHKVEIKPDLPQQKLLRQNVGARRFAYNWGLAEMKRRYAVGERMNLSVA